MKESYSLIDVIRALGLSDKSAGNYGTIRHHIRRLQLDIRHFDGQSWIARKGKPGILPLESILTENSTYKTYHLSKRLIAEGIKPYKCEGCGLIEWMSQPITLELDHINGINNDHRLENLRLLCPNCHSLTPTWRGRNKLSL